MVFPAICYWRTAQIQKGVKSVDEDQMKHHSKATLQEHQLALYELLQAFDSVCKKHNIRYMLFAGTALGAVRHKGFIPWDDDLDVVMLRPEYERFLEVAQQELDGKKFFLQKEFSEHWPMFFSKLRLNGTTCLERFIPKDLEIHQGVYIDLFPCDNLSDSMVKRKLQFYLSKIVIAKSLNRRGYLTDSVLKKLFMAMCSWIPDKKLRSIVRNASDVNSQCVHTFFGASSRYEKAIYPRRWFEREVQLPFEAGEFPVSAQYDLLLTKLYGDYSTPLPPCERNSKVHAEFVDLKKPYTEYLEYQKTLKFSGYTRSIR